MTHGMLVYQHNLGLGLHCSIVIDASPSLFQLVTCDNVQRDLPLLWYRLGISIHYQYNIVGGTE
jgi:hypothetical protein